MGFSAMEISASVFFSFDSSELPIVSIYAMYIPIFIMMMKKEAGLGFFKRFLMPSLAILACIFMVIAACFSHGKAVIAYIIVFIAVMVLGYLLIFERKKSKKIFQVLVFYFITVL